MEAMRQAVNADSDDDECGAVELDCMRYVDSLTLRVCVLGRNVIIDSLTLKVRGKATL